MFIRSVKCGFCETEYQEEIHGDGFPGWTQLLGITDEKDPLLTDPHFCPECTKKLLLFLNDLKGKSNGMG